MPSQILSADAPQRCVKYPEEAVGYAMDFSKLLASGETITSIISVVASPTGTSSDLAITGQAIVGSQVQMKIAAGAAGTSYRVAVQVNTSLGYIREGKGSLVVVS